MHAGDRAIMAAVASYSVNESAVARARELIDARQYVLRSQWGEVQPSAADGTAYLESHSWDEYAAWHLGLTEGATEHTKGRYAFVYGDFRRLHRMGLIACQYRAAEWGHKDVELAAHDLLQYLDGVALLTYSGASRASIATTRSDAAEGRVIAVRSRAGSDGAPFTRWAGPGERRSTRRTRCRRSRLRCMIARYGWSGLCGRR